MKEKLKELNCGNCGSTLDIWSNAIDIEYGAMPDFIDLTSYYECKACEILIAHPQLSEHLHQIYPKNYYSFANSSGLLSNLKKVFDFRLVRSWLNAGNFDKSEKLRVADLGGGVGYFGRLVAEVIQNSEITVVDFDNMPNKNLDNFKFQRVDLNQSFPFGEYDLIIAWNILEHLSSPSQFLNSCLNHLSINGHLAIQTPNYKSLNARLFKRTYWGGLHAPRHFTIYSGKSLLKEIEKMKFEVVKVKYVQGAHFWAVSCCKVLGLRGNSTKSIHSYKTYNVFLFIFAVLDSFLSRFSKTSQIQILARVKV